MAEKISKKEKSLYEPIKNWLSGFLENKNPRAIIEVYDIHFVYLSDFLEKHKLKSHFSEYATYKIKVDLLGIVKNKNDVLLTFIEVKDTQLALKDVAQLIGYSKIVKPYQSFLISPKGLGKPLNDLLNKFKRLDILEYELNKKIIVAKWSETRNAIMLDSAIPSF